MPYWWTYMLFLIFCNSNVSMNMFYICYCPHSQMKLLCLKKKPIKNGDHYPPKTTVPIHTPNSNIWECPPYGPFTNNVYYLSLSSWLILLYLHFLEYKWDLVFFQMLNWPCAFLSYSCILPKYFFSYVTNISFKFIIFSTLFMASFTIIQLNLWISSLHDILTKLSPITRSKRCFTIMPLWFYFSH